MEIRQLRYVEAVARHRHFTRAAAELHVAQSALSQQVRRLEDELGTKLFERTSRSVVPTEAGAAVAARARELLQGVDALRGEVDELKGLLRGRISVGTTLPAGEVDVPATLVAFRDAYPGIELDLHEGTAGDMRGYLTEGRIDAAFSLIDTDPPAAFEYAELSREDIVAVFPEGDAPAAASVDAAALGKRELITPRTGSATKAALDEFLAAGGETAPMVLESGDPFFLRVLVASGFGTAILPASLLEREGPSVEARRLDPPVSLRACLVWRRHSQAPAARAFIDFVTARARILVA